MADNFKTISDLDISFKEFMPGQIIQSAQFNDDMRDIEEKVNEVIGQHNGVANTVVDHLNNKNNPHEVTAHQVGTYTVDEIDGLIEEVKDGHLYDNAITNRVLGDGCVDNRTLKDKTITAVKVEDGFGNQIDISENIEITDRYTKSEVDELVRSKVGEGAYTKEEIDQKFEEFQSGQIIDKTISADKVTSDFGDKIDISNNTSIINRYTKGEVDILIAKNGLPRDWGGISDEPTDIENRTGSLPVAGHMVAGQFVSPATSVLDIDVKENVEARGEFNSVKERLDGVDSQIKNIETRIDNIGGSGGSSGGEVDLSGYVTKETGNANQITFADGQTFQAKLDNGILKGEKGDKGDTGNNGKDGLTTSIQVNGKTYNHVNGVITLPNYPTGNGSNNASDITIADTAGNYASNNVEGALQEVDTRIKDKANQIDLEVERKRIDSFTNLSEGSTTGDAELIDARIGANGTIYNNLGNSIREQIKLINSIDFSRNIFNKDTVVKGKFRSSSDGSEKDNSEFSYNLVEIEPNTDYIMTGSDFDMQFFDANMNFLGYSNAFKGDNVVFNCDKENVKYVAINYTHAKYNTDTYMVCKGTEMPSSFEKYGYKKLKKDISVDYSQITNVPTIDDDIKTYTVGANGEFKTFTAMLRALKNDTSEKIVYIERGTYDIFEEMGGTDFTTYVNDNNDITNWKHCCDIVPNNTKLIGIGEVILKYKPTADQTNKKCASLISPLNIMGNVYVENITVEGTNCRYTIHQENSAGLGYDSVVCKMKNVKATKWLGSYGNPQVFGSGIGKDSSWEFDNCEFYSDMTHIWTVHTNEPTAGHSASIIMNNCIIDAITPSESTKTREMIRFITGDEGTDNPAHNKAKMNNCYIGGKLTLAYDGKLDTIYNSWDLLLNNVHTESEEVYSQFAGNNYPIKKYTY